MSANTFGERAGGATQQVRGVDVLTAKMHRLIVLPLVLIAVAARGGSASAPATQPAKTVEGFRMLEKGSWVVTQAQVMSNGVPTALKRKMTVTTHPSTGQRMIEESRWSGSEFAPTGEYQPMIADRRGFDELGLTPEARLADQALILARRRYSCSVTRYLFRDEASGRTTMLTLWRDKSGQLKLPARSMQINNHEVPLPGDALQAEFTIEGPKVSSRGTRRILALASPLRVNGTTHACLVESTQTQGTSNEKAVSIQVREWYCAALPGERLRTQTTMSVGPMRVDSDVCVVDFYVAGGSATTRPASAE